ncbi:ATP-binding protein [Myxococcota bacterium]|nr:ATP-binding protein [Myxococcota bacterium]MBU1381379.1 ATP-binding protein [Myxococcota bacterium]MBU1498382.1 ATP-binding protein [Myxococcota bacterium]
MLEKIWKELENLLEKEITPINRALWISPLIPLDLTDGILRLSSPSDFMTQYFKSNYQKITEDLLRDLAGEEIRIEISTGDHGLKRSVSPDKAIEKPTPAVSEAPSNRGLRTFATGEENSFAVAACRQVLKHPGKWNPLFLYGKSGTGKTHLAKALLEEFAMRGRKVKYTTGHEFYNSYIATISTGEYRGFYSAFTGLDLLVLDDVQFLQGKDKTQETFFNIFNTLFDSGAQIVLVSQQHPAQAARFESALLSRFTWGLLYEMEVAGRDLKREISALKAREMELTLSDGILDILGSSDITDMRQLEGCIKRLAAISLIEEREITERDIEKDIFSFSPKSEKTPIELSTVQNAVCCFYDISMDDLVNAGREIKYSKPRQIAMYLAKKHTNASFPEISRSFKKKAHSTVVNAVSKVEKLRTRDIQVNQELKKLEQLLLDGID